MEIRTLGKPRIPSPIELTVDDRARCAAEIVRLPDAPADPGALFEIAGPRSQLFFESARACAGIVTCGGLCPGLNNVIRSVFLELHHIYGVPRVLGFRDGYAGLDASYGQEPVELTPAFVHDIHRMGGTVLGTSRGPVDISRAVDNLAARGVDMLFTVGGDGTQRGALALCREAERRGLSLAVVGIPKTIDNDVAFVARTFGFLTAVEEACKVITCAHTEAHSVRNGVSIVKLMGREAGFIAASATIASQDVNFTLIPEVPFALEGEGGLLAALVRRVQARGHAVIVAAEGAGQDLLGGGAEERDASGNVKLKDIGLFLRDRIASRFAEADIPATLRYFDPSYMIRSVPADAEDSILCDLLARNAVHAALAGKTGMVIGLMHDTFVHVPMEALATRKKRVDPAGETWRAVLAATGQPARFA